MPAMNEWKDFFNYDYAPQYEEEIFTQNTTEEVRFLVRELNIPEGSRILDVGCGTGRHAIPLAQKGYRVTGVDISPAMLKETRKAATRSGVDITLIESDAQEMSFPHQFDAAICLCEGALSLLGSGDDPYEHDVRILENIFRSLKPNGKFITTVLNAYFRIRNLSDEDIKSGRFDPVTMVAYSTETRKFEDGERVITVRERFYTPAEFVRILHHVGFTVEGLFGGTAGDWNKTPVKLDEWELMAIAFKP